MDSKFINDYFKTVTNTIRNEDPNAWDYDTHTPDFKELITEPMQDNNYNSGVEKVAK
jgi:hypothetical protein